MSALKSTWYMCVCVPEVLRASRADVLVQVVPFVFLQSLMAKLHPAGHKLSIRVWRTQAVAVLDLSRLVWVPTHTHTHVKHDWELRRTYVTTTGPTFHVYSGGYYLPNTYSSVLPWGWSSSSWVRAAAAFLSLWCALQHSLNPLTSFLLLLLLLAVCDSWN